ncbi:MAG TPA: M48 family metalloprotease [Saprospiraceae bacterium]|nr:M48 family metalloprotease [Saprospiraceae bacterium]HNT19700.1 M48 family metalloprotease [Saprospiraceae bacterium]
MAYSDSRYGYGGYTRRTGFRWGGLLMALLLAGYALCKYYSSSQYNEITGEEQHVGAITKEQEIALGLESAPYMAQQHGGLYPDERAQAYVKKVGHRIVQNSVVQKSGYQYDFHLLADPQSVNAFALPGGQVFITLALFSRLENEDQLAGIFGHEIGHVIARHGAQRMAQQELAQGLTGAAVIAAGDYQSAQGIQMIANLISMSYGRDQELESDDLGVRFMYEAGYRPEALLDVMRILEAASQGQRQPEFFSTHPSPENRLQKIQDAIDKYTRGKPNQISPSEEPIIKLKDPNLQF